MSCIELQLCTLTSQPSIERPQNAQRTLVRIRDMLTAVLAPVPEEPLPCGPLDARPNRPVEPILRSLLYRKIHMEDAWQRSRETAPAAGAGATINSPEQRLQQRQANDHYDDFVDVHTDQSSSTDVSGLTSDSPEGSLTEGSAHTQAGAEEQATTPATSVADQDEPVSDTERSSSSDAAAGSRPTAPGAAPVPTLSAGQQRSHDSTRQADVVRESLLPVSSKIVHFEEAAASSTRPMQQPISEAQAAFSSGTEPPAPADARAAAGAASTSSRGAVQPSTQQPSSSSSGSSSRSKGPTAATAATAQAGASSSEAAGGTNRWVSCVRHCWV